MSTTAVTPAAPAPATSDEHHLIPTDATWRKTGIRPEAQKPSEPAAPAPAESAPQGDSAAAPEAAPQERPKRSDANTRIRELIASNKRLEAQLEEARRGRTAEPSPAPAEHKAEPPKALQAPQKPKQSDFKTWEAFEEAKDKYHEDLADYKVAKAKDDVRRELALGEQQKALNNQLDEGRKRYKDLDSIIKPVVTALTDPKAGLPQRVAELVNL